MEIKYCDICGMVVKGKLVEPTPQPTAIISPYPSAISIWNAISVTRSSLKPFTCNLEICEVCDKMFNLFCMKLVEIRRNNTKEMLNDEEMKQLKEF